eukprot:15336831-Ditylum_brightwellii.AAC.1
MKKQCHLGGKWSQSQELHWLNDLDKSLAFYHHSEQKDMESNHHNMLKPAWDVIAQISDSLKHYKTSAFVSHVKDHQDDNTSYDDLEMPA